MLASAVARVWHPRVGVVGGGFVVGPDLVATCAHVVAEAVDADPPDIVVTDIRMPPTGTDEGIRAAGELRASHPDIGVVVPLLAMTPSIETA